MQNPPGMNWWLFAITAIDACFVGGAFLFVRFGYETVWPTSLIVMLPQWLWLMPPAIVVLTSALARSRWFAMANGLVLCFAAVGLSGFACAVGSPARGEPGGEHIRIVTWNVHNEKARLDEIRRELRALAPDVICLQEAFDPVFTQPPDGWEHVDALGVRIQTRWEMADARRLGRDGGSFPYRAWAACEVETPAGELSVLNVHFAKPFGGPQSSRHGRDLAAYLARTADMRATQFDMILAALPASRPAVVAGDFNTPPSSSLYRMFARRMSDCFAAASFGFGYTYLVRKRIPSWRLDYVWSANGARPVRCFVGKTRISDHRPVVVDIALPAT